MTPKHFDAQLERVTGICGPAWTPEDSRARLLWRDELHRLFAGEAENVWQAAFDEIVARHVDAHRLPTIAKVRECVEEARAEATARAEAERCRRKDAEAAATAVNIIDAKTAEKIADSLLREEAPRASFKYLELLRRKQSDRQDGKR